MNNRLSIFASPLFIVAVATLLFNDLYLKGAWPGLVSGKLSDIAGLFALPLALSSLFPRRKLPIYGITALLFTLWKMPCADGAIAIINSILPYSIGRTVDYGDLWTLLILPFSYLYRPRRAPLRSTIPLRIAIAAIACFAFCFTAGTHGRIKTYHFGMSKYELQRSVDSLLVACPELQIPNGDPDFNQGTDIYFAMLLSDADGTEVFNAHYYGSEEYWNDHPRSSALSLISVGRLHGDAKINNELSDEEKARAIAKFENVFISRLAEYLPLLPAQDGDADD